ncbi:UvrD-helicase domain-containing protein [Microbacterium sp.]|uniref:HelD family protein n=1 Tax=Microbacterium sp. TaxID=51671 RepID=UPI003568C393
MDTQEYEEHERLARTVELLEADLQRVSAFIDSAEQQVQGHKDFMWEHRRDMDHAEKASMRTMVDLSVTQGEHALQARERIIRLLASPYFGRVDFREDGARSEIPHYIGVHTFRDPEGKNLLVHDWRAPVSSLYYDFESGEAEFHSPTGLVRGEITGKRQYKIVGGQLQYVIDSTLNIGDEVLQEELSHSADEKMKNIVATIQREQNAVIRNETSDVLILQGVAGSGKTSIALHRVAFLLYRFKDTLSSENVMILSPNRVFGDYISEVLPELGEEQVTETSFERIADRFLKRLTRFQRFSEQVSELLTQTDGSAEERIRFKATTAFVELLDSWIDTASEDFQPDIIEQQGERMPADWVSASFSALRGLPIFDRLDRLAYSAIHLMKAEVTRRGRRWTAADSTAIRRRVRGMFGHRTAFDIYKAFYASPNRRDLFQQLERNTIEFADVFPLIYTMLRTSKHDGYGDIRHLLVDEMQDYTPIQYAVLRKLFNCRMTILGDANQSVNPFSSSSLATIRSIFPDADALELCRSYRSTTQITAFAQNIAPNDKLIPIDRPGPDPLVIATEDEAAETKAVISIVDDFASSDHRSLGIICKTVDQAKRLHAALSDDGIDLVLLDYDSASFASGVVITSAHIAKGLEFDRVIVPHADSQNYRTDIDRGMLYIACTRAMHHLTLTYHGTLSSLLAFVDDSQATKTSAQ